MCSSLRFRFTISLPPTSPGWRWTKMTRWVLYFQSFISITRIISIFSIHRWSHCPGGSCQSQCDSLWILLRAVLRLSRLGPVVWRALRGLRLHKEHTGGKQWSGDFWRLGENLEPFQAYELHLAGWTFQVKKLEFSPQLKPSESTNNPPLKICPHNQMFFLQRFSRQCSLCIGALPRRRGAQHGGKGSSSNVYFQLISFPQAKLKQQEEVGSFWWIW